MKSVAPVLSSRESARAEPDQRPQVPMMKSSQSSGTEGQAWQADAGCFVEKSGRRQGPQKIIKVFVFVLEREAGREKREEQRILSSLHA